VRHHREDIVERAVQVLDDHGLGSLTMRRLGSELGLQASAIYHHFPSKQALLAAVADELLARGRRPRAGGSWDDLLVEACYELRDAMLAYRDGADLVATVYAFGLGARGPGDELEDILAGAGFSEPLVGVGARTLLHFVFGHTFEEQTALQAESAGAIEGSPSTDRVGDFDLGLGLVLDGLAAHVPAGRPVRG
jgi:TetR/AcrR family transcriptional regulator, tetracycline repressor protein